MKPTEELKKEHQAIKLVLKILQVIIDKIVKDQKVDQKDLESIVDFLKTFVDKCHHGKEENLLFPMAVKRGLPKDKGPIAVMLTEHTIGRDCVAGMSQSLKEDKINVKKFSQNAQEYVKLLNQHIDKEDQILYLMIDQVLSRDDQNKLEQGFAKVETEIVGAGKHDEYHQLLDQLKEKYL